MAKVSWREQALADLDLISEYIAAESPASALRYIQEVRTAARKLNDFPEVGRVYAASYRVLVVRHHLLLYRIMNDDRDVVIVNVLDSRRDPEAILLDLDNPH